MKPIVALIAVSLVLASCSYTDAPPGSCWQAVEGRTKNLIMRHVGDNQWQFYGAATHTWGEVTPMKGDPLEKGGMTPVDSPLVAK